MIAGSARSWSECGDWRGQRGQRRGRDEAQERFGDGEARVEEVGELEFAGSVAREGFWNCKG